MTVEKRFQYSKPSNTEERIEAIYEELSIYNKDTKQLSETLKDYLVDLVQWTRKYDFNREMADDRKTTQEKAALGLLATITFSMLLLNLKTDSDWEWLNQNTFAIRMAGWILAGLYLSISIERSAFFLQLWRFGVTKFIAGIAFSTLVIASYGPASAQINELFHVDASNFPFTRTILVGIFVFKEMYIVIFVIGIFAVGHGIIAALYLKQKIKGNGKYEEPPVSSIVFLLIALLFTMWANQINNWLSKDKLKGQVYQIAHKLDFNANHQCNNLPEDIFVVFIGSQQSKVLTDDNAIFQYNLEGIIKGRELYDTVIPNQFPIKECITNN